MSTELQKLPPVPPDLTGWHWEYRPEQGLRLLRPEEGWLTQWCEPGNHALAEIAAREIVARDAAATAAIKVAEGSPARPGRRSLPPGSIRRDGGTQARTGNNEDVVETYTLDMREGRWTWHDGNRLVVFFDGEHYWLADGFHRTEAAQRAGLTEVPCDVREGSRRDAVLYAVSANADHGLRRTREDVRRAVRTLLLDEEWRQWSNGEIARRAKTTHPTVADVRRELEAAGEIAPVEVRIGSDGKARTANPKDLQVDAAPARPNAPPPPAEETRTVEDAELVNLLAEANSCGRIAVYNRNTKATIKPPVLYDGKPWVCVASGGGTAGAVGIVPLAEWPYRTYHYADRMDRTGYTGIVVWHRNAPHVLTHERLEVRVPKAAPAPRATYPETIAGAATVTQAERPSDEEQAELKRIVRGLGGTWYGLVKVNGPASLYRVSFHGEKQTDLSAYAIKMRDPIHSLRAAMTVGPYRWKEAAEKIAAIAEPAERQRWEQSFAAVKTADAAMIVRDGLNTWAALHRIHDEEVRETMLLTHSEIAKQYGVTWPPVSEAPRPPESEIEAAKARANALGLHLIIGISNDERRERSFVLSGHNPKDFHETYERWTALLARLDALEAFADGKAEASVAADPLTSEEANQRGIYLHTPRTLLPADWDAWRARMEAIGGNLVLSVNGTVTGSYDGRRIGTYRLPDRWHEATAEIEVCERRAAQDRHDANVAAREADDENDDAFDDDGPPAGNPLAPPVSAAKLDALGAKLRPLGGYVDWVGLWGEGGPPRFLVREPGGEESVYPAQHLPGKPPTAQALADAWDATRRRVEAILAAPPAPEPGAEEAEELPAAVETGHEDENGNALVVLNSEGMRGVVAEALVEYAASVRLLDLGLAHQVDTPLLRHLARLLRSSKSPAASVQADSCWCLADVVDRWLEMPTDDERKAA